MAENDPAAFGPHRSRRLNKYIVSSFGSPGPAPTNKTLPDFILSYLLDAITMESAKVRGFYYKPYTLAPQRLLFDQTKLLNLGWSDRVTQYIVFCG